MIKFLLLCREEYRNVVFALLWLTKFRFLSFFTLASVDSLWSLTSALPKSLGFAFHSGGFLPKIRNHPLKGTQSTHKVFSPCIPDTDKSPIALRAPTRSPHFRDWNAFGNSLRNTWGIWENHILAVSLGSSSIQVLGEFWGFLSKLYTGLCYLLKAAIFTLSCCHDLYFTTYTYTWRYIILHIEGVSVKAPWNSVQNLITFLLVSWFSSIWEVLLFLDSWSCQLCCS